MTRSSLSAARSSDMTTPTALLKKIVLGPAHTGVIGLCSVLGNRPSQRPFFAPVSEKVRVFSYFCIVNTPGRPDREIAVLAVRDDVSARAAMTELAAHWPGYETICLYEGERPIAVLGNPHMGLATDGLELSVAA